MRSIWSSGGSRHHSRQVERDYTHGVDLPDCQSGSHGIIRVLADQYSDAANSMDAHGMAAVYAEDAVLISFEHRFEGRAAIEKMFGETISLMELMNQVCSGAVISIDVDRATARWTVTEFAKRKALDKLEMFIGNYDGELVRTPQGWRFSKRVLTRRMQCRFEAKLRA